MKRPWQVWTAFVVCVTVVLTVMAWGTHIVMDLERTNRIIQMHAVQEQTLRLALWRMDSTITPLIIEESARPYFEYNAFNPASAAQTSVDNITSQQSMNPSALLANSQSSVNLYFNTTIDAVDNKQEIISPQVPNQQNEEIQGWLDRNRLIQAQIEPNKEKLKTLKDKVKVSDLLSNWSRNAKDDETSDRQDSRRALNEPIADSDGQQLDQVQYEVQQAQIQQTVMNVREYSQRKSTAKKAQTRIQRSKNEYYDNFNNDVSSSPIENSQALRNEVTEDSMQVLWVDGMLILGRKVRINDKDTIQGAWLNWDNIKGELLSSIEDLYPDADLVPVKNGSESGNESRMMTVIPAMIIPGKPAISPMLSPSLYRVPVTIGWICTIFAVSAVGFLLFGAVSLSERRGAFVSAVTHELRTPLTTLRIYTEMLAEGLVRNDKKDEYIATLNTESKRLGNLVENVLAYARLERGRGARTLEEISVGSLLERISPRLTARAGDASMQFVTDMHEKTATANLFTDVMAVDQILFNLVDNACKYATDAEDRRIHLAITRENDSVLFRVCDHGSGLQSNEIKKAFKPFRKSAKKAAQTAPGVGLGLALCRRVTRQLGGSINYEEHSGYGACFKLSLPMA